MSPIVIQLLLGVLFVIGVIVYGAVDFFCKGCTCGIHTVGMRGELVYDGDRASDSNLFKGISIV